MKTLKEWAEAHGVTFVVRSAGMYTTGTVSAGALEELFAAAAALRRERDELAARLAEIERAEPVAWVPMHPREGALWSMTTATPSDERLPSHYPLSPLYKSPAPAAAPGSAEEFSSSDDPRCKDGQAACIDCLMRGSCLLSSDQQSAPSGKTEPKPCSPAAAPERAEPADGCGACGDACQSRASCRLADETPMPADPLTPPPGYRLLGDNEPAQAGDMAYIGSIGGRWRQVRPRMGIVGATMDELSDGARVLALARPCRCGHDGCGDSTSCHRGER